MCERFFAGLPAPFDEAPQKRARVAEIPQAFVGMSIASTTVWRLR